MPSKIYRLVIGADCVSKTEWCRVLILSGENPNGSILLCMWTRGWVVPAVSGLAYKGPRRTST